MTGAFPFDELESAFTRGAASGCGTTAVELPSALTLPLPLLPFAFPLAWSGATVALSVLAAVACTAFASAFPLTLLGCVGGAASGAAWLVLPFGLSMPVPPRATAGTAKQTRIAIAQNAQVRNVRRLCGGNVPVGVAARFPLVTNCRKAPR